MRELDYQDMFRHMHPGFFQRDYIQSIPRENIYEEMILCLEGFSADAVKIAVQPQITFDFFHGDTAALLDAVRQVDDDWPKYFKKTDRVFCGWDGETPVSFCLIEEMKSYHDLKIGGPGCVGTVPAYRKKGIGLRMVQLATEILKNEGYDLSYIHYTGVADWYARLGYQSILQWTSQGILTH